MLDIAQTAARLIVEDGLDYGNAKRQAIKLLGLPSRTPVPDNDIVEDQVREHIAIFHADTQPKELLNLRKIAAMWMQRLQMFRPHLTGSVWHGTATRQSDVYIQLFCDDPKSAEIALIDHQVPYEPSSVSGMRGKTVDALSVLTPSQELGMNIMVHFLIYDHDDLRGALKPDSQGRTPRGDLSAVLKRLEAA